MFLDVDLQSRKLLLLICMTSFVLIARFQKFCCSNLLNLWLLKTGSSSRCLVATKWKFLAFFLWVLNMSFCWAFSVFEMQENCQTLSLQAIYRAMHKSTRHTLVYPLNAKTEKPFYPSWKNPGFPYYVPKLALERSLWFHRWSSFLIFPKILYLNKKK